MYANILLVIVVLIKSCLHANGQSCTKLCRMTVIYLSLLMPGIWYNSGTNTAQWPRKRGDIDNVLMEIMIIDLTYYKCHANMYFILYVITTYIYFGCPKFA